MMYGLFQIDLIEDFYQTHGLICVATSKERLEARIAEIQAAHTERIRLKAAYRSVLKLFPEFDEQPPQKEKLGFTPRTREEHKLAEANCVKYDVAMQEYMQRRDNYDRDRADQAWGLFLDLENKHFTEISKELFINNYLYTSELPEMYVKEVEVLE